MKWCSLNILYCFKKVVKYVSMAQTTEARSSKLEAHDFRSDPSGAIANAIMDLATRGFAILDRVIADEEIAYLKTVALSTAMTRHPNTSQLASEFTKQTVDPNMVHEKPSFRRRGTGLVHRDGAFAGFGGVRALISCTTQPSSLLIARSNGKPAKDIKIMNQPHYKVDNAVGRAVALAQDMYSGMNVTQDGVTYAIEHPRHQGVLPHAGSRMLNCLDIEFLSVDGARSANAFVLPEHIDPGQIRLHVA